MSESDNKKFVEDQGKIEGTSSLVSKEVDEESKSSFAEYEFPLGYISPEGNLYDKVILREMTGEEEDIFAARKMSITRKINKVLANCIVELGSKEIVNVIREKPKLEEIVARLPSIDRMFLLVRIRQQTHGNIFGFDYTCHNLVTDEDGEHPCELKQYVSVNLSELDVKMPVDKKKRLFECAVSNGRKVEFRIMDGGDDQFLNSGDEEKSLSEIMMRRVTKFDGRSVNLDDLKKMSIKDRKIIRREMEKADAAGMDSEIEIECAKCKKTVKETLRFDSADFFFPEGQ
ncbi:MAG: hypothetical protein HQK96_20630 [Nitrospirae bacterium]|nr:hypothetical protein [Nitrospirota bacterium]